MARQDHTHAGIEYGEATFPYPYVEEPDGSLRERTPDDPPEIIPGSRRVYHSHPNGMTPHGHEPCDKHGASGAAINNDVAGYTPGYAITTAG